VATFGELRQEIAGIVKQTINGLLDTEIKQAINDAIVYHSVRRFPFTDGADNIFTTAAVPDYSLPTDFLSITHAQMFWGGSNFTTLKKRNWSWYLKVNQDASQLRSVPSTYYALRDQRIYLYPTPSDTFQVQLYYIRKLLPSPLVADGDMNEWTVDARVLIRQRALWDLYLNKTQQKDYALNASIQEADELERLARQMSFNLGQQELTPFEW